MMTGEKGWCTIAPMPSSSRECSPHSFALPGRASKQLRRLAGAAARDESVSPAREPSWQRGERRDIDRQDP